MGIIYITFVNLISEDMFEQGAYGFRMTQFPIELQILSYTLICTPKLYVDINFITRLIIQLLLIKYLNVSMNKTSMLYIFWK